jgi:hypothetical protein
VHSATSGSVKRSYPESKRFSVSLLNGGTTRYLLFLNEVGSKDCQRF